MVETCDLEIFDPKLIEEVQKNPKKEEIEKIENEAFKVLVVQLGIVEDDHWVNDKVLYVNYEKDEAKKILVKKDFIINY